MHDNMCGMSTTHPVQCHNQTASYVQHHISCNESCSHIINLHSDPPPPSLLHPAHLCRAARPAVSSSEKVCDGVRARSRITATNAALPQTGMQMQDDEMPDSTCSIATTTSCYRQPVQLDRAAYLCLWRALVHRGLDF